MKKKRKPKRRDSSFLDFDELFDDKKNMEKGNKIENKEKEEAKNFEGYKSTFVRKAYPPKKKDNKEVSNKKEKRREEKRKNVFIQERGPPDSKGNNQHYIYSFFTKV